MKPRALFTDGFNSLWHVIFGILAIRFWFIMPIFIIYQLLDLTDANWLVDILEFCVGFFASILFVIFAQYRKIKYNLVDKFWMKLFNYYTFYTF
jgi:hypothetical protein